RGADAARAAVAAQARAYGVGDEARLAAALDRWLASSLRERVRARAHMAPELPFSVSLGDAALWGAMDLVATDGPWAAPAGEALIVDYKTGGSPDEAPADLRAKHALQAACYAYAALAVGYEAVELVFVRVEQASPSDPAEPQQLSYRYAAADLPVLEEALLRLAG
ncbi:PD-(D/E)XK nuclease family protein, partial [Enterorhabdus sp. P55]|uniref:PD-(D/E)XK nuclease family protein n=1 Tax=Enterorhabdus sp. P55 TaxID=2304571 RepID=UPI001369D256